MANSRNAVSDRLPVAHAISPENWAREILIWQILQFAHDTGQDAVMLASQVMPGAARPGAARALNEVPAPHHEVLTELMNKRP